jgi:predicted RNase H-like nuclease (RuvC/YqgF family)
MHRSEDVVPDQVDSLCEKVSRLVAENEGGRGRAEEVSRAIRVCFELQRAREQQLESANRQINDLIALVDAKVTTIHRLKSEIEWMNNRRSTRLYRKIRQYFGWLGGRPRRGNR